MRSFMSIPPVGENPTTKSYFWRRIPFDVHVNTGEQIRHFYPLASRASGTKNPLALMIF